MSLSYFFFSVAAQILGPARDYCSPWHILEQPEGHSWGLVIAGDFPFAVGNSVTG